MKNVWKRILCLLLSGVLLLGNVPVQALATEEFVEELVEEVVLEEEPKTTQSQETEPQETKPKETKPQDTERKEVKVTEKVKVQDSVKKAVEYPVFIDGKQLTDQDSSGNLGEGTYSYNDGVLTLKNVTVTAETENAIEAMKSLTIILEGENSLTAKADHKAAILVNGSLTIEGGENGGTLEAVSEKATAIHVFGSEDAEGNKSGLMVIGDVTILAETKNTESALGIESPNGVDIGEGDIHLKTNIAHSYTDPETTNPKGVYTLPVGYVKVGDGTFEVADNSCMPGSTSFEFVSSKHLEYTKTDTEHSLVCNKDCEMSSVTVLSEAHSKGQEGDREAGCGLKANCSVCGEYGSESAAHLSPNTSVVKIDNTFHKEIWDCCEAEKSREEHSLNYTSEGTTITATCTVEGCGATGTVTLVAENAEYTGAEYAGASCGTPEGVLTGMTPVITYTNDAVENDTPVEDEPTAIGNYTAHMTLGGQTVEKKFSITKISLADATVTVSGEYTYNRSAHEPEAKDIEVKLNDKLLTLDEDYTISGYSNNTNAGTATVMVTAAENSNYMDSAIGEFVIKAKEIVAEDVKLGPALTYTGAEQEQTVVPNVAEGETSDVTFEVTGNKNTDAGSYKLTVKGTGNYCSEVTMDYTIEKAKAVLTLTEDQIIAGGTKGGDFAQPKYMADQTELEGTFIYSLEGAQNVQYSGAKSVLQNLSNGDEREITFVFTPKDTKNYTSDDGFTGSFKVTVKSVRFAQKDKSDLSDNVLLTKSELIYGDNPVNTDAICAFVDDKVVEPDAQYTVIYTKVSGGDVEAPLAAGNYTFTITYTGTVGDIHCESYPVYTSENVFVIKPKQIVITKKHTFDHLTYKEDTAQPLLNGDVKADVTAEGIYEWKYRVNNTDVTGVPKRENVGVYQIVYYAKSSNPNYLDSEKVTEKVAILPVLEAEYGEYLEDIDLTGTGFEWDEQSNPKATTLVGNVNDTEEKRTFILNYTKEPLLSNISAVVTVLPKKLTPTVTLNDNDGYIHYDDRLKNNVVVKDGGDTLKFGTDYTLGYAGTPSGLKYQYTVKDVVGGNYEIQETSIIANLYRQSYNTLVESNFPKDDLAGTANSTLEKVKSTLTAKVKATDYPETAMKYFSTYVTKIENKTWVEYRNEGAFPPDGVDYVISYAHLNATKNDKFKVSVMDTFGKNAGKEAKVITSTKTDEGLKIHLNQYAAVCVAKQVKAAEATEAETKKEYKVSTAPSSYGTVKFRVGSSSTLKTSGEVKVGETITVVVTPKTNYAVTKVQYTYKDGTVTKLGTLQQDDDGEYTMKMKDKDITLRATFAKKTSSSKNPYSGDTSHIYLWITVLAASAAAIVAVMIFWFKKRKQ